MTLSEYNNIKQHLILEVSMCESHNSILKSSKELFRSDINSPRRFEQTLSIGQLVKILEVRDVISEENIEPMKIIANKLPNSQQLLNLLQNYQATFIALKQNNYKPLVNETVITKQELNTNKENYEHNSREPTGISTVKKERIHNTIIEEIGTFWRDLARNLNIREGKINEIDDSYSTLSSKASNLLLTYEKKSDPSEWFDDLCDALEESRRKDLKKNIQKIMRMNI